MPMQPQRREDVRVSPRLLLRVVDETDSTQDEAKRFLSEVYGQSNDPLGNTAGCPPSSAAYAVLAHRQTRGRGTQGRHWECGKGNLFLTVALPVDCIPVRLTLLPLQVAVLVAQHVHEHLSAQAAADLALQGVLPKTTVKWPNDVLVDDKKISGTLIENYVLPSDDDSPPSTVWLLVGTGVNLAAAPDLQNSPGKHGRNATCLLDLLGGGAADANCPTSLQFGIPFARSLVDWAFPDDGSLSPTTSSSSTAAALRLERERRVVEQWREFSDFGQFYEIRAGTVEEEQVGQYQGEIVQSVDVQDDGQLLVRDANGNQRLLIADYLF